MSEQDTRDPVAAAEEDEILVNCVQCGDPIEIWDDTYGEPDTGLYHLQICAMEYLHAQLAVSQAEIATLTEQLAYWKTCANCGVEMTTPGHCDTASLELSEGWTEECAKHRERQEAAEAAVATLRTNLGTALSVGVAQHAEIATLRQALQRIRDVAFQSFRGGQFKSGTPMAQVHQVASDALAVVPAPPAPQE